MRTLLDKIKRKTTAVDIELGEYDLYEKGDNLYIEIKINEFIEIAENGVEHLEAQELEHIEQIRHGGYMSPAFIELLEIIEQQGAEQ